MATILHESNNVAYRADKIQVQESNLKNMDPI